MMIDAERSEWRTRGLEAGKVYAEDVAARIQGHSVENVHVQDLIASIGVSLQEEAQRLRDGAIPEELIEEYTRAVVENVMLRMHAYLSA